MKNYNSNFRDQQENKKSSMILRILIPKYDFKVKIQENNLIPFHKYWKNIKNYEGNNFKEEFVNVQYLDLHTFEWKTIPKYLFDLVLDHKRYTVGIKLDREGIRGYERQLDIIYQFVHNIIMEKKVGLFQNNNNNNNNTKDFKNKEENQYNYNHKNQWYKICRNDSDDDEDPSENENECNCFTSLLDEEKIKEKDDGNAYFCKNENIKIAAANDNTFSNIKSK